MQNILDISLLSGPILVTVLYFILWYYLLFKLQVGTKFRLIKEYQAQGKVFDRYFGQDEQMLAADRSVINTQEQMLPFIVSFWLYAIFLSPVTATWLGSSYIILRFFYPILLGKKISKQQSKKVIFVTLPSYLVIFYMLASLVWQAF